MDDITDEAEPVVRIPNRERLKRWSLWVVDRIPIVGKLRHCSRSNLIEAFYEVFSVGIFSTLPLWFFPLISYLIFTRGFPIGDVVGSGELFIYSATFSGTMVYFISKRYGSFQSSGETGVGPPLSVTISFPYGGLFVILSALICMLSAAVFFILKTFEQMPEQTVIQLSEPGMARLSWWLFGSSMLVFYCAMAYRNMLDNVRQVPPRQEEDFVQKWMERQNG